MAHFRKCGKYGKVWEKTKLPLIVSHKDNSAFYSMYRLLDFFPCRYKVL